jgi:predicted nucleic acid-binding protein
MRERLVINTGPLIALALACGDWDCLRYAATEVIIPAAVLRELRAGPRGSPGQAVPLPPGVRLGDTLDVPHHLLVALDAGEAAVIATALHQHIPWVAIDEVAGRRVARIHSLQVTGSLGILVAAARQTPSFPLDTALERMRAGGIRLSPDIVEQARRAARA